MCGTTISAGRPRWWRPTSATACGCPATAAPMLARLARRPSLRIRVLAGVLLVTVVVLSAFDLAAVTGLRRYLYAQTDSQLADVLSLYKPFQVTAAGPRPGARKPHVAKVPSVHSRQVPIRGPHLFV